MGQLFLLHLTQLEFMIRKKNETTPLNIHTLITSDRQKCVNDHLSIFILSFRKRKSCKKLYIEFCLKELPIHFLQRVLGSLIFMAYLKPATHLVILYTDRHGRRIKSPISGMSDIGDQIRRNSPSLFVPAIFSPSTASRQ